jgi:hypothetical protein
MCAERLCGPQTKATTAWQKEKASQRSPLAARKLDRETNEQELQPATAQTAPGRFAWTLATLPILPPEASRSVRSTIRWSARPTLSPIA